MLPELAYCTTCKKKQKYTDAKEHPFGKYGVVRISGICTKCKGKTSTLRSPNPDKKPAKKGGDEHEEEAYEGAGLNVYAVSGAGPNVYSVSGAGPNVYSVSGGARRKSASKSGRKSASKSGRKSASKPAAKPARSSGKAPSKRRSAACR